MEHGNFKPEGNLLKAALTSGFNFTSIMKEFVTNMSAAGGGGGKDGGQSDGQMQQALDKMSNIFA